MLSTFRSLPTRNSVIQIFKRRFAAPFRSKKNLYGEGRYTWTRGEEGSGRKVFHKGWKHMEARKPMTLQERWYRASLERLFHPSIIETLNVRQLDDLHTKDWRMFFETQSLDFSPQISSQSELNEFKLLSPWHDIPIGFESTRDNTLYFNYINEIGLGDTAKMECATDEDWNPIKQDIKKGALRFFKYGDIPFNYGFIPQTWENDLEEETKFSDVPGLKGDNDPIDVCELSLEPLPIGRVVPIKVLNVLGLIDEGEIDWKVIGLRYDHELIDKINTIQDANQYLGKDFSNIIIDWFKNYKTPDGKPQNAFTHNEEYKDASTAVQIIEKCHQSWYNLILGGIENTKLNKTSVTHKHLIAQELTTNVSTNELPRIDYPKYDQWSPTDQKATGIDPQAFENSYEEYELNEEAPDQRKN